MKYLIYKATFSNSKCYIGQTSKSLSVRKNKHIQEALSGSKQKFHLAIKKYQTNIKWEILEDNIVTKSEANIKEQFYIKQYQSNINKYGYNCTSGGDGFKNGVHSEKTKRMLSEKAKARKLNPSNNLKKFYNNNPNARSEIQKEYHKNSNKLKNLAKDRILKLKRIGKMTGKPKKAVIAIKDIAILEFSSMTEAAKELNVSISGINAVLIGKLKTLKGFKFYELKEF